MATLKRTPEYRRASADLSFRARIIQRVIEQRIESDPDNHELRVHTRLAGAMVVVEANGDVLVYFHRLDADAVSLDLIVDLRDPPDWFISPHGKWAERLLD